MANGVGKKIFLLVGVVFGLSWLVSYRNSVSRLNNDLRQQLKISLSNVESMAIQLKITNEFKDKMVNILTNEKDSLKKDTQDLNAEIKLLKSEAELLKKKLSENLKATTDLKTHEELKIQSIKPFMNQPFDLPQLVFKLDTENNSIVATSSSTKLHLTNLIVPEEVNNVEKLETKPEPAEFKQLVVPPIHEGEAKELSTNKISTTKTVIGEHKYVNENSVHFHRQESANKNLEFQRENNADHGGEHNHAELSKTTSATSKTIMANLSNNNAPISKLLQISIETFQ